MNFQYDYDSVNDYMLGYKRANQDSQFNLPMMPVDVTKPAFNSNSVSNYFQGMSGRLPDAPSPAIVPLTLGDQLKSLLKMGDGVGSGFSKAWKDMPFSDKLNAGVGAFNSAMDAISAHRAYKLGKSQLNFERDAFNRQYEAQKGLTNSQLVDRQNWRIANNPNAGYLSADDYIAKYGVK